MENHTVLHENILPLDSTNVNFCTFIDNGTYTPSHWHSAIDLKYMLEGKIYSRIENPSASSSTGGGYGKRGLSARTMCIDKFQCNSF